jgi:hypothetical protein
VLLAQAYAGRFPHLPILWQLISVKIAIDRNYENEPEKSLPRVNRGY